MITARPNLSGPRTAALALVLVVVFGAGVACGGGSDGGQISEAEASETASRYFTTTLGLFTGATEPQAFIDLFAPECREDADLAGLAFVVLFMQAFAPELQGIMIEEVDPGDLILEHTEDGTLVSPVDPNALRLMVDGVFVPAQEFFAQSGFEPTDDGDLADPVLLVRRDGNIYLGDCAELEGLAGG